MKPRLLDLFCGAGGASVGYARAGFEVVGIDLNPQPNYPFEFYQVDALGGVAMLWLSTGNFDAVHASPPCQAYSITKNAHGRQHPELVEPVRKMLTESGLPWIIENVPGAPLHDPVTLCGSMFGLTAWDHYIGQQVWLKRHRLFESSVALTAPPCQHPKGMRVGGVYSGAWSKNRTLDPTVKRTGGYTPPDDVQRLLMGIDWMPRKPLAQSIPPAYTEWLGAQLLASVQMRAAA